MEHIELYTRPGCVYCMQAKRLLISGGKSFVEHNVIVNPNLLQQLRQRTHNRTFPQVFIDGVSIGGFEDLLAHEQSAAREQAAAG